MRLQTLTPLAIAGVFLVTPLTVHAADDWPQAHYLYEGKLEEGAKALTAALERDPTDRQARYGLGVVRLLQSVEHLAQALHKYGLHDSGVMGQIPFLRLPVPPNPDPQPVTAADLRATLVRFTADLKLADDVLARLDDTEIKLPIDIGHVGLDLDGDGKSADNERLWVMYQRIAQGMRDPSVLVESAPVVFDRGDVAWIRGYTHLLRGMCEIVLAYDMHELFDHAAHLAFKRPKTPFPFLRSPKKDGEFDWIVDGIAAVHVVRFPVKEPDRMKVALAHLQSCIALSRESWKFYQAETDDDHEWIPNEKQTFFLGGRNRVTREMITDWAAFLDEFESILAGKTLVPFHREPGGTRGINIRRVFTEPTEFDLVLWVQGTSAVPYLEEGPITKPEVWQRLQRTFGGQFFGFAMWFN